MGKYPTNHDYLPVCSYEWMTSSLQTVKSGTNQLTYIWKMINVEIYHILRNLKSALILHTLMAWG